MLASLFISIMHNFFFRKGSLIVSADVVVNEAINSSNTSLNSALQQIGSEIFTIDNQTVLISHVLSNGVMSM